MKNSSSFYLRTFFLCVFSLLILQNHSIAQSESDFTFQGVKISIPENIQSVNFTDLSTQSGYNNSIYAWIQFNEIPNQEQQDAIKNGGVEFIDYIAKGTYLVRFSATISRELLLSNNVKGIIPVHQEVKIESNIRIGSLNPWAIEGQNAKLNVVMFEGVDMDEISSLLQSSGVEILTRFPGHQILEVSIPISRINSLGDFTFVKWVEEITAPSIKEDTKGKSLHRSNGLDTQTSTGRQYTGENIGVLVRDDGIVGPHIDFEGRLDNSTATGTGQTHGDGVAGILTGAGNLDPTMRGMAAGANVFVSNYASSFLDAATTDRINNGTVQITNSSYGNGCNDGYTTTTVNVDNQIFNNPTVLHVFSCGNSGGSDCGFGAGSGWGNITGGHKQGKNVIATANLYFDGSLVNSSSRGPAYDGRIKPDIAANGVQMSTDEDNDYLQFGGTSGASPGIAGVSAQLYQAYSEANGGTLPPSALIKATLLNTTNDAGNIGPDYKFGWGIVNGLRAGMLIEDGRHLTNTVSQGNLNSHSISVPAGTKQVRFMLYWMDPAATNGASIALINDLDLVVSDPIATTYLPWILNPAPNATTLDLPATNGADHLNNMEQVVINNPIAGTYTIDVSGFAVPMGPQDYFVVYEIITEEITVTYPNRGEHFVPGEQESIHWDAPESTGTFTLEYSDNNGGSWNAITSVASEVRTYEWTVPTNVTGTALLRVTRGGVSDDSDSTFSIAPLVIGQSITKVCPTEVTFFWNATPGADSYDVYVLGTQYMEIVGNSASTTYIHTITDPNASIWYAMVAKNSTSGWESRRTIASYYDGGLLNCAFAIDVELASINSNANFLSICNTGDAFPEISIMNAGLSPISNFPVTYEITGQALVTETYTGTITPGQQVNYTFTTPLSVAVSGNYTLTCTADIPGDLYAGNNEQTLDLYVQATATATPFIEDFQAAGFMPSVWSINNPDNDYTWEEVTVTGPSGAGTDAAFVNNYSYNAAGEEDYFETEIFSIAGGMALLSFDLAKVQYSNLDDSLAVQISGDCGVAWTTIYAKGGATLETAGSSTGNWSPSSANDWRNEVIDISSFLGQNVMFRFININGYGNSTFIDNINVTSDLSIGENDQVHFSIFPNPTGGTATLSVSNELGGNARIVITNQVGQTVQVMQTDAFLNNQTTIDLTKYQRGIYFVTVYTDGLSTTKRIIKN
ncbi:MAG: S8 family serine peptidase [Crocinitomicaceae bacterium]|nr:S8 family serine peptidase [Flavobacteriales bacterium]NQZ37206.1 S8 family serine peptidase [Crocinitomicaceae bacterium]